MKEGEELKSDVQKKKVLIENIRTVRDQQVRRQSDMVDKLEAAEKYRDEVEARELELFKKMQHTQKR